MMDPDGSFRQRSRIRRRPTSLLASFTIAATIIANPSPVIALSAANQRQHVIKVCQNKDCRKRYSPRAPDGSLVQTLEDLLLPTNNSDDKKISIESSGCLSQCGKGPNICVVEESSSSKDENKERLFFGVDSASTAAAILVVACDYDPPVNLIIAADKISKAQIASSSSEKESLVTPIIETLSSDTDLSSSPALSHALTIRADARLDDFPQNVDGALEDSRRATDVNPKNGRAWRVRADAEEAAGDITAAIEATSRWAETDPSFATKARNEINRLSRKAR